jgi:hypothetical protein
VSAPLSNFQKEILSKMSRRAFARMGALARGRGEEWPEGNTADHQAFRHDQVSRACQKRGLRCCSQDDYPRIKAHFQQLLGEDGRAFNTLVRGENNGRRIAEHKLAEEMQKAGIGPAYVEKICMTQNKCRVLEASEKQLWHLMYTVRNRAAAKKRTEDRGQKTEAPSNIIPLPTPNAA